MGKDLAEQFPAARAVFDSIDAALATPLSTLMFAGPEEDLTATQNAQPAILAHTAAVCARMAGCAFCVAVKSSSGPANMRVERGVARAASIESNTARAAGNCSARSFPIPT